RRRVLPRLPLRAAPAQQAPGLGAVLPRSPGHPDLPPRHGGLRRDHGDRRDPAARQRLAADHRLHRHRRAHPGRHARLPLTDRRRLLTPRPHPRGHRKGGLTPHDDTRRPGRGPPPLPRHPRRRRPRPGAARRTARRAPRVRRPRPPRRHRLRTDPPPEDPDDMPPARPTMLTQAAQLLAEGQATSRELTDACLAAIDAHDQELRAFITVEHDTARSTADACDARRAEGAPPRLLDGLPVAVKDNLDVAGRVTTMGSEIFRDHVPTGSAAVVDRLEEHGAVRLGATNLHEFALGVTTENPHHGICRNPWATSRTPGGSSGGPAVAVASGMALAALGTDTSGSIRIPAAACGIVGLKPTYGRISSVGCYPEAWSLDHVGVLTSSVADAALLLDALSGHDPR